MRNSLRYHPGPLHWVRLGAFLVVLAGVVGMHGLSLHGLPHGSGHGIREGADHTALPALGDYIARVDPTPVKTSQVTGAAAVAYEPLPTSDRGAGSSATGYAGDAPTAGGLAELCLAVLLIGLTVTLIAAVARHRRGGLPVRPPIRLWLLTTTRDRDPPSLTRLCVLRC